MESGWYILRLYLWWLPSYIPASEGERQACSKPSILYQRSVSTLTGMDVCDRAYSTAAAESDQNLPHLRAVIFPTFCNYRVQWFAILETHAPIFSQAAVTPNVPWKWHIVEGIAVAAQTRGVIPRSVRPTVPHTCSVDGTFEYLNEITEPGSTFRNTSQYIEESFLPIALQR